MAVAPLREDMRMLDEQKLIGNQTLLALLNQVLLDSKRVPVAHSSCVCDCECVTRTATQCHLVCQRLRIASKLWGGPPGPRGSPWTRSKPTRASAADQGVCPTPHSNSSSIDGKSVDVVERLAHRFVQRRMGVDCAHQRLHCGFGFHRQHR